MKRTGTGEQVKPYRLYKYFTMISLVVLFIGTLVLTMLTTHWAKSMQNHRREDIARLMVENLNHQIFTQFVIPVALKYGEIQLRQQEQFERLDKVVRNTLHSFQVDSLNIYDTSNIVSYSFDTDMIGKTDYGGADFKKALAGENSVRIDQQGSLFEIVMGRPKQTKLITFSPLRAEKPLSRISGPVLGVVEIVQDLSEDYQTIFDFQKLMFVSCTLILGVLFIVLFFVVKRGERIMQVRAKERLALKEQLSRAERLSAMGEMAASISHEIRNPLGIIRSSAQLLKKKVAEIDSAVTITDIIIKEASRLNDIITDFINYARPRSPKIEFCHLEDILAKTRRLIEPQAREQGISIVERTRNELPEIKADADMLHQAFLNILINAMQAMGNGGTIRIEVGCSRDSVHVFFDDQGGGIPEQIQGKIWDPFFTTKDKGTGLGLGIVRNIIESHGGSVQAANRKEGGIRMTVVLPLNSVCPYPASVESDPGF